MKENYAPAASDSDVNAIFDAYPADITAGSPFDTGVFNALTPVFKSLSAMQGDLVFQAPRRFFLENTATKQPTWSFRTSHSQPFCIALQVLTHFRHTT